MPIIDAVLGFLAGLGRATLGVCVGVGRGAIFTLDGVSHIFRPPFYPREIFWQIMRIGWFSLPVVGVTAIFTGAALALQVYSGSSRFSAESAVPTIVAIGMVRELGPVLAALMVTGRVAASIAAELGTMRVTEQIDALTTLSTNPMKYLVAPRLLAGTLTMPVLVLVADIIGIMGGHLVSVSRLGFNSGIYLKNTADFLEFNDVASGLVKAAVFGFIITLMGCYHGYRSGRGAQGVGLATTNAVVAASILILGSNYVLTQFFFGGL